MFSLLSRGLLKLLNAFGGSWGLSGAFWGFPGSKMEGGCPKPSISVLKIAFFTVGTDKILGSPSFRKLFAGSWGFLGFLWVDWSWRSTMEGCSRV